MKFIRYGGIFILLGSFFLLETTLNNLKIEKNGTYVKMRIEKLPVSCLGTKNKHFATFYYEGNNYIKGIPAGYCEEHHVGELVDMKYLGRETKILFPEESQKKELVSNILLSCFGLAAIIYSFAKKRK